MKREDLAWLLGMANDMRTAKGDATLDDLPISVPEDIGSCLVANAFNYDCEVDPRTPSDSDPYRLGTIQFQEIEDVKTYCKITGLDLTGSMFATLECPLTPELNAVAVDFDNNKYDEYNYYVWVAESNDLAAVAEREQWIEQPA